jgi:N-acetylglucosamine-6-phosphate deacetylase
MMVIDIHTHGIGGYDTGTDFADHILKIAGIHGSFGVSKILPAIYPATIRVMRENIGFVKEAMKLQNAGRVSSFEKREELLFEREGKDIETCEPAEIAGVYVEGPFLNPAKCGALNAMTFLQPTEYSLNELSEGFEDIIKVVTIAPELEGALDLIKRISEAGIIVSMGHSDATYAEAEAGFEAGAKGVTHIFNAMRGFHHREPGIAGFGLLNHDVYIEVIADPFHLHAKTLDLIFRTKRPDKIIIVSDAVRETKTGGKVLVPAADSYGKLIGGAMTVTEAAKGLIESGYDEDIVMKCITENPAMYLAPG